MLIATLFPFTLLSGDAYQLKSFVVTVLGGLGNPAGALLGGIALGLVEGLVDAFHAGELDAGHRVRALRRGADRVPRRAAQSALPCGGREDRRSHNRDRAAAILRRPFFWIIAAIVAVFALAPGIGDDVQLRESLLLAAVYIILASNLNLMLGYAGYVNFGSIVFFGLGGYICVYLMGAPGLAAGGRGARRRRLR